MGTVTESAKVWLPIAVLAVATVIAPAIAGADLICPASDSTPVVVLAVPELVELVLSRVLHKGVAVLLLGATAIVSVPWLVAGVITAVLYAPRWLKAWW